MATIILTGPDDRLGSRVASCLQELAGVDQVVSVDPREPLDVNGAGTVVLLGGGVDETKAALDAAGAAGVAQIVLLSSATVYGAWPENPVPLGEDAMLRPNPGLRFAVRAAERERLASEWKMDEPGRTVAVLRPTVAVADGADGWLARSLRHEGTVKASGEDDPPQQFVHLDDVAAAVAVAVEQGLDGPYNVASDGWLEGRELRALTNRPRLVLPKPLAHLARKVKGAKAEPGLAPYARHPWVIDNQRLKATGWKPGLTNEEAVVESTTPMPWATVSPQRRQEIALGVAAMLWIAGQVLAFKALRSVARRLRHRHRRPSALTGRVLSIEVSPRAQ
ncbi:MAG: NAD-dependent epimerase/dehydratase family protein [Acidimicrobiia bacterium]